MKTYETEAEAVADGFSFGHDPLSQQFTVERDGKVVGFAHYALGPDKSWIDFNHTVVIPEFRGSGISRLLAARALTDDLVDGRSVRTSCWFIEEYVAKNPEILKR